MLHAELVHVLINDGTYVNQRHIWILVNAMTHRGYLMPINRHGLNRLPTTPLVRCSFEETTDVLLAAAATGARNPMHGLTESVMFGKLAPVGTGACRVLSAQPRAVAAALVASEPTMTVCIGQDSDFALADAAFDTSNTWATLMNLPSRRVCEYQFAGVGGGDDDDNDDASADVQQVAYPSSQPARKRRRRNFFGGGGGGGGDSSAGIVAILPRRRRPRYAPSSPRTLSARRRLSFVPSSPTRPVPFAATSLSLYKPDGSIDVAAVSSALNVLRGAGYI